MRVPHFILPVLAATLVLPLHAQEANLASNQDYKDGMQALLSRLPAVAAKRLEKASKAEGLSDEEYVQVMFRLCEAQVRALQGKAAEATLADPKLKLHSDRAFWTGQAYFAQGRYSDAAKAFEQVVAVEKHPRKGLALVALYETYTSLGEEDKAFAVLEMAASLETRSVLADLRLVEAYLDKESLVKARTLVSKIKPVSIGDKQTFTFLNGKILLAENKPDEAEAQFKQLLGFVRLKPGYKDASLIGIADATAARGQHAEAVAMVLKQIEEKPGSSVMHLLFNRVISWSDALSDTAAVQEKLGEWIVRPKILQPEDGVETDTVATLELEFPDRDAFSHYALAYILSGKEAEVDKMRALELLNLFREAHAMHSLRTKSWVLTAKLWVDLKKIDAALAALEKLEKEAFTADAKARAVFLKGQILVEQGEEEKGIAEFKRLASGELKALSEEAKVNIALLRLKRGSLVAFSDMAASVKDDEIRLGLQYERALIALAQGENASREALEKLLKEAPNHHLAVDTKLALAKNYLSIRPINETRSVALLASLQGLTLRSAQKMEWIELQLRVAVFQEKWDYVVKYFEKEVTGAEKASASMLLSLGEAYYRNNEFNKARREFNKVCQQYGESPLAEYAYFFAGMAARKEGTPQSKEEATGLFEKAIDLEGALHIEAVIQLSRLWLDSEKIVETQALINKTLVRKNLASSTAVDLKILLADALHRSALKDKTKRDGYQKAITLYKEILATPKLSAEWKNRVCYLLGQTQEKIDPTNLTALDSYFKVVNLENQKKKGQPVEWQYYYMAGLRAVDLLESQERWEAAALLLEKMAGYFGPKSDQLLERANKIRLEQQIW